MRVKAQEAASPQTRENLQNAVNALCAFAGESIQGFGCFTEAMLGEWVSMLIFQGYSPKTVSNNIIKRIATLYNKAVDEGLAMPTGVFRQMRDDLEALHAANLNAVTVPDVFSKLQDIFRTDCHASARLQLAKDILLFSIYMGGISFDEIAAYKKNDYKGDSPGIREIVRRYARPRNKYLFPLDRGNSGPGKAKVELESLMRDVLGRHGLRLSEIPSDTSFLLWAFAAISCGVSASDVAACVAPRNKRIPVTSFVTPSELDETRKVEIRSMVESTLANNPVRWYAMHLRPHVGFDELTDRVRERGISLDEIYYPMEDVLRKVGKKKIFESRPVISWLVFFRSRVTFLNRLFKEVGDLAWGYRYLPDFRSPYAVIGDSEIRYYQQSLGTLTPSTQLLDDDDVKFNEGDYLVILGGPMNGRHGVFIAEKKEKGEASGRVVFRISLAGGNNVNWEVNWDPRLVKKITESQYMELDTQLRKSLDDSLSE